MPITVETVHEDGVLKLSEPLPFKEHVSFQVTVQPRIKRAGSGWELPPMPPTDPDVPD
jgi:predicted DNA-binding antitoxin AbrB/MazE fold protein